MHALSSRQEAGNEDLGLGGLYAVDMQACHRSEQVPAFQQRVLVHQPDHMLARLRLGPASQEVCGLDLALVPLHKGKKQLLGKVDLEPISP